MRLWRDPDARRALGERAFRAARRHRWDALARQQGDIYTEIVKAGTKGDATGGSRRFLSRGGDRA